MATSLLEESKKIFGPVPLLQSGNLLKATPLPDPENLEPKELEALRQMGDALFQLRPTFVAVAFTQFPPKVYEDFEADPRHTHIVHLSPSRDDLFGPLSGSLLINPKVRLPFRAPRLFVNPEGCGSIEDARLDMFIPRPPTLTLDAYVYNPAQGNTAPARVKNIRFNKPASAIIEHESHHLNGLDTTNSGVNLLDPWQGFESPEWAGYVRDEWLALANQVHTFTGKNFLVRRNDQLLVLNGNGEPIRKLR